MPTLPKLLMQIVAELHMMEKIEVVLRIIFSEMCLNNNGTQNVFHKVKLCRLYVVLGFKSNCSLVGPRTVSGMISMGIFLRDLHLYLGEFR